MNKPISILVFITVLHLHPVFSQIPVFPVPQPSQIPDYTGEGSVVRMTSGDRSVNSSSPQNYSFPDYSNSSFNYSQTNYDYIEKEIREYMLLKERTRKIIEEADKAMKEAIVNYDFNDPAGPVQIRFESAFEELSQMLEGTQRENITRAVALVENALDPSVKYEDLKQQVQNMARLSQYVIESNDLPYNDNMAKILGIFHVMADTTVTRIPGEERNLVFYPLLYDFKDPWGREDYTNVFVSKLLRFGTGNCSSLPRLFMMVAEEIDAEAYLAFSPNHSYIKFRDDLEEWHNIEMTNQMFTTDDLIMESGWVKAEAIRSGIYMNPISKKELVAQSVNELALANARIFGFTPFTQRCLDLALQYYPNSITAHQIKANYYISLLQYIAKQFQDKGYSSDRFVSNDHVIEIKTNLEEEFHIIDSLGFAQVPEELYNKWIKAMNNESNRQRSRTQYREILNSINR